MRRLIFTLASLGAALLLAACNSEPVQEPASDAVSQRPAVGDARNRAKIHTELASAYFENGNMAVAIEELRVAIEADSGYAPAYNMRGLVHMVLRENAIADQNFRYALSLAGGDPEINNNYGWFLCQTGREKDSIKHFLVAVKNPLYQTPEKSYTNAGICALKMNDLVMAEDYLELATRRGRNVVATLLPMAKIKFRKGANVETRTLLADLHRQAEPSAESLWLAVRNERVLGDRSAEANFTGQLRRRFPDSPEAQEMKRGNYQ